MQKHHYLITHIYMKYFYYHTNEVIILILMYLKICEMSLREEFGYNTVILPSII